MIMMAEESIKVAVRVRPFNARELQKDAKCIIRMSKNTTTIYNPSNSKDTRSFTFDYSYWSHNGENEDENGYFSSQADSLYIDQEKIFEDIGVAILDNTWKGYNTSLFAYGQTGSGKSWSVIGYGANKGIVPRFCEEIFNGINQKNLNERVRRGELEYQILFSMLEIYNERVHDLLDPYCRFKTLKIREHPKKGFYADGLITVPVKNYSDMEQRIALGVKNRTIAETNLNECSSRAHTIVCVTFIQKTKKFGEETVKSSVINMVDLAGSERACRSGATGDHLKEGASINQSLSNLGNCMAALVQCADGKKVRVPYRDSALTKLLKNALGGNSKTIMIAAISPAHSNYEDTLSTLRYADRAKRIKTNAIINEDPIAKLIRELQEENNRLQKMFDEGNVEKITCTDDDEVNTGMTEEELRAQMQEEISALVIENERMLKDMENRYEEKLAETETEFKKKKEQRIAIAEEKKVTPHIYNLSPDAMLTGKIVHLLKQDINMIGRSDDEVEPHIPLLGVNIMRNHGQIKNLDCFRISKNDSSRILVNGVPVIGDTELHHHDRILIGTSHLYVFSNPEEMERIKMTDMEIMTPTYEDAQVEIAIHSGIDAAKIPTFLRILVDFLPDLNEANGLSEELDKKVQFEPIVMTPEVKELMAMDDDIFCKVTQLESSYIWFWSKEKLLNRKYLMQEMYLKYQDGEEWDLPEEQNPFTEPLDTECLIGVTQIYLKSLSHLVDINVKQPLIDYRGLKIGELKVSILICNVDDIEYAPDDDDRFLDNPEELLGKRVGFQIIISQACLPKRYTDVFCLFSIFHHKNLSTEIISDSRHISFNYVENLTVEKFDQDILDIILHKSLVIQVSGKQRASHIKPINKAAELGQTTREIIEAESLHGRKISKKDKVSTAELKTLSEGSLMHKKGEMLERKLSKIKDLCDEEEAKGKTTLLISELKPLLNMSSANRIVCLSGNGSSPESISSLITSENVLPEKHEERDVTKSSTCSLSENVLPENHEESNVTKSSTCSLSENVLPENHEERNVTKSSTCNLI